MLGWMLFITLLVLVIAVVQDMNGGYARAFGWPAPMTNWTLLMTILGLVWLFYLLKVFHIIKFWFQK